MEWYYALALLIGMLIVFMLIGMPVVFAFFMVNIVGAWVFMRGEVGLLQFTRNTVDSLQTFALLPIPLFIFMGEMMFRSGVAARAIDAVDRLISQLPGRLSLVAICGGTIFSSLSGSTIANTAMLGSTLLPEMYRRGYQPSISIGPIVAVGGIAMLIPPSALAVLLGSLAQISIGELLVASIIPALILAAMFFAYIIVRCAIQPELAPTYDAGGLSFRERMVPFLKYVVPLMGIFVVVVGSIIFGIATPTESAALGAAATVFAAAAYRSLSFENFIVAVTQTMKITVMTLFIIAGSVTFSQIMAFSGASSGLSALVLESNLSPMAILVGMLAVLLVLGCFMDQVSMMLITIPLYMPVVAELGFNEIWFGVLMLMILEISLATPPFGLLLFVIKGVAPAGTTMRLVISSVLPFIAMALAVVVLLVAFPGITLVLPSLMVK
ncbi:MAG: TRAP transporter large permease [Alphaproteobacteria bacterium]|jgi:tripartite ATP-independent transporter DctM subunit|nr:TRAP transporter large permease [Alphaproteobacteria bacterium]HJP21413.1 TRAP transporter large permease [Alphaproteobacteria bacterium]